MRSGVLPIVDSLLLFREASSKQEEAVRKALLLLEGRLSDAYREYDSKLAQDPGLGWLDGERVLLASNWPKVSDTELRARVLRSTRGVCAYCGANQAAQLDHYLPKKLFGEYAIHVSNLVPSCGPCNQHKAQRYKLPDGSRRYSHPFFAPFPDRPLIRAEIQVEGGFAVTFAPSEDVCVEEGVWEWVATQFEDLHLNAIYVSEAVLYVSDRYIAYEGAFADGGAEGVRSVLRTDLRSCVRARGKNYWEVVLLEALLRSEAFCDGGFRTGAEVLE